MEAELETGEAVKSARAFSADDYTAQAYLSMLWGALAFASMGALGHLAGERCSWQLVAVARTSLALIFSVVFALVTGVRLVFSEPLDPKLSRVSVTDPAGRQTNGTITGTQMVVLLATNAPGA